LRKKKEATKSIATQHCWIGLMEMKKEERRRQEEEKLEGRCNRRYYIRGAADRVWAGNNGIIIPLANCKSLLQVDPGQGDWGKTGNGELSFFGCRPRSWPLTRSAGQTANPLGRKEIKIIIIIGK
jgi:hypothetical protein